MLQIFETLRLSNINFSDESFVRLEAPSPVLTNNFCVQQIKGSLPIAIIDGNNTNAYANEVRSKENQWILFEFINTFVYVHSLIFHSLCHPPQALLIQGSIDKQNWVTIGSRNSPIPNYTVSTIPCFKKKSFKYIKISQNVNTNGENRIHVEEIDIFGDLGIVNECTSTNIRIPRIPFLIAFSILK